VIVSDGRILGKFGKFERTTPMLVAFVLMKTEPAHIDDVVKALVEMEIVEEMHSLAGDYDLIVKVRVEDFDHLARLVVDRIQRVPHLRETKTLIAFDAYNVPKLRGS
jgi:DNA-binding Lrp family transcriptional regulator